MIEALIGMMVAFAFGIYVGLWAARVDATVRKEGGL